MAVTTLLFVLVGGPWRCYLCRIGALGRTVCVGLGLLGMPFVSDWSSQPCRLCRIGALGRAVCVGLGLSLDWGSRPFRLCRIGAVGLAVCVGLGLSALPFVSY